VRGGYGRFFDKTHLESIGGLFTATPFTSSFTFTTPVAGPDLNPRNGALPVDPLLANGPTINTALLAQMFPGGQLLPNTGASWDSPNRRTPYTDQVTAGFERQLGANLSVSADFVHSESRDMLMLLNLNPQARSNPNVNARGDIGSRCPRRRARIDDRRGFCAIRRRGRGLSKRDAACYGGEAFPTGCLALARIDEGPFP
jgi:hypothetical protein